MPSPRRMRALMYIVLAGVVTLLFFTSQARHSRDADFYSRTVDALGSKSRGNDKSHQVVISHDHDADGDIDGDDAKMAKEMADRLKQAEKKAKENANAKAPNKPDAPGAVIGVGSAAGGQHKGVPDEDGKVKETAEEHEIEVELNTILKKSPGKNTEPCPSLRISDLLTPPPQSHHLFEIILPIFEARKRHPAR